MTNLVQTYMDLKRRQGWTMDRVAQYLTKNGTRTIDRGAVYRMAAGTRKVPECCANVMLAEILAENAASWMFPMLRLPTDERSPDQRAREAGL